MNTRIFRLKFYSVKNILNDRLLILFCGFKRLIKNLFPEHEEADFGMSQEVS